MHQRDSRQDELSFFQYVSSYRIISEVAEGGMGKVYLAEQLGVAGFTKTVGIKTIRRDLVDNGVFRDLFVAEAKLVADLIHENILQVYQLVDMAGTYAIIMEWIHGLNLEDINARLDERNEYLDPEVAVFMVSRVARALAYAHEKRDRDGRPLNLVHRDINPMNIFVNWQGVVKLADFGIAKARTRAFRSDEQAEAVGKTPYLSPEQALGGETDGRSDIFSLGVVLYELLTGEQLYPVEDVDQVIELHRSKRIPSPKGWNPDITDRVEEMMRRMLAIDPDDRYQTAREVMKTLETYLYHDRFGPTNEKLAAYLDELFPEVDKHRLIPEQVVRTPSYY